MNQSKASKLTAISFLLAYLTLFFALAVYYHPSSAPVFSSGNHLQYYTGFSWDAIHFYAPMINGEMSVEDWHSALYMYECRFLLYCEKALGIQTDGIRVQITFYYLHLCAFLSCLVCVLYYTTRNNSYIFAILLPLCFSTYFMFKCLSIGLDFFFFVHLFIMSCCSAFLSKLKIKQLKTIAWAIILISLFHAVNFRKNAVLLVPFICFLYTYKKTKQKDTIGKIVLLRKWLCFSVIFSIFSIKIISWVFPVIHTDPIIPMLSSDLRIAAILRGEQKQFREELQLSGCNAKTLYHPYCNSLTAYWSTELGDPTKPHRVLIPDARNIYIRHWINDTGSMLCSRLIQTVEFYCGGCFPVGKNIIEQMYPSVKTNSSAWKFVFTPSSSVICIRLFILLGGIILLFYILYRRYRKGYWEHSFDKPTAIVCTTAIIYAATFIVVPPAAETRYLAPSLLIILNSSCMWLIFFFSSNRGKIKGDFS